MTSNNFHETKTKDDTKYVSGHDIHEIHRMVLNNISDPHGVTLLTEPRGEADHGGDLVVDRDHLLEPQHARSHHRAHPEPGEADTGLENLDRALAPDREEAGGGQEDGGGAPEDGGG